MTNKDKIINGLDKELMQLIDAEMNDPVIGKLLNRNAAYVLGKEIKLVLIERVCEWLNNQACLGWIENVEVNKFVEKFKKDFGLC